jgi:hypothetical protein
MNRMLYVLLMLSLILCCVAATHGQTTPPTPVGAPLPPPLPTSPVETFRKVLAMSAPEREKFLSTLTAEKRQIVMLKLEEYQGLPPDQREQRLRALQSRVWVRQLIKLPASNRVERLVTLQPADRQAIEDRLTAWDRLPVELQKEVLTNEIAIRHIARSPDFMFNAALPPFPLDSRIAQQLKHWGELSKADRTEVLNNFQYFMEDLSEKEREKALAERPDAAKSLAPIASLPKEQRDRYMAGFKRFAALNPAERQKFLINAAHWQKLTPEQRESWRVLAKKLNSSSPPPPPPVPGRSNAARVPALDSAALDIPSR